MSISVGPNFALQLAFIQNVTFKQLDDARALEDAEELRRCKEDPELFWTREPYIGRRFTVIRQEQEVLSQAEMLLFELDYERPEGARPKKAFTTFIAAMEQLAQVKKALDLFRNEKRAVVPVEANKVSVLEATLFFQLSRLQDSLSPLFVIHKSAMVAAHSLPGKTQASAAGLSRLHSAFSASPAATAEISTLMGSLILHIASAPPSPALHSSSMLITKRATHAPDRRERAPRLGDSKGKEADAEFARRRKEQESPNLSGGSSGSSSAAASAATSPLPSPASGSAAGTFGFRKSRRRGNRGDVVLHVDQAGLRYKAFDNLFNPAHFPRFDEIMLLVNIEENWKPTEAECGHLMKLRNKLPQQSTALWQHFLTDAKALTYESVTKGATAHTVKTKSGKEYTLYEYTSPLLVHFTRPQFADAILTHITQAKGEQAVLLENDGYIMRTTPKLCVSLMQSGRTSSYYSLPANRWPGVGLSVAVAQAASIVAVHPKDSYSPTYFQAPGVSAYSNADSLAQVEFFNNFWMRFSIIRSYIDTIYQAICEVSNPDPIRQKMVRLKAEWALVGVSQNVLAELDTIINAPYTSESVQAAFQRIVVQIVELTKERKVAVPLTQIKVESAEQLRKVLDAAPKESVAAKYSPATCLALLQEIFPNAFVGDVPTTVEKAFNAVIVALQKEIAAPKETAQENTSALLENLKKALLRLQSMNVVKGSDYDKWLFERVFKHRPGADESTLSELEKINEFLKKLCAESLAKLRKANDPNPDWTIFGSLLSPEELLQKTAALDYNELNVLTYTAKAVGLSVPTFNGVVLQDYMAPNGIISDEVEGIFIKAMALKLPLFYMRTPDSGAAAAKK